MAKRTTNTINLMADTPITYDANVDTLLGDKLMIFVKGEPIAFGTSCSIDISADTIDTANKMAGAWKAALAGQMGYTITSDSLLSKKDGHMSYKKLKELMAKREPVEIAIASVKGSQETGFVKDAEFEKGTAFITQLSLKADNGAVCTSSITLTGSGELASGTISPSA